jgi:hypothetical protein
VYIFIEEKGLLLKGIANDSFFHVLDPFYTLSPEVKYQRKKEKINESVFLK